MKIKLSKKLIRSLIFLILIAFVLLGYNNFNSTIIAVILISIIFVGTLLYNKDRYTRKLQDQQDEYCAQIKELKSNYNAEIQEIKLQNQQTCEQLHLAREQDIAKIFELTTESEKIHTVLDEYKEQTEKEIFDLQSKLNSVSDKYHRAQLLYPGLDSCINNLLEEEYRSEAQKIDADIIGVFSTIPTKDNEHIFEIAINKIICAETCIRKYITSDLSQLEQLHSEAIALRESYQLEEEKKKKFEQEESDKDIASNVYQKMKNIYSQHSEINADNLEALIEVDKLYQGLTDSQKRFFPDVKFIDEYQNRLEQVIIESNLIS